MSRICKRCANTYLKLDEKNKWYCPDCKKVYENSKFKIKRFDKVKVSRQGDIYSNKVGVVVSIVKTSNYPYNVCFGVDRFGNGKMRIYFESDLIKFLEDKIK